MALILGVVLGFLSGVGIGGGTLLILWFTMVTGMDPSTARVVNLLFYLPCAGIAAVIRWKQGSVNLKKLLPAILAGCIAAGVFTWVSVQADTQVLRKLFGGLLIATGIREIGFSGRKSQP